MSDGLYCVRGCIRFGNHLTDCGDDNCRGCEPREVETGYLCSKCLDKLHTLLGPADDHESIPGAWLWLADNLGQHIRTSIGGKPSGDGSTTGDHMAAVMDAMAGLRIALVEFAAEFREARQMSANPDTDPGHVAAWLRPWLTTLADWEPIGETLEHLLDLMRDAHAAAPWRGKDPDDNERVAAMLYLAPAETTDAICHRFGITADWLKKAKRRKGLKPVEENVRPLWWRPWDCYAILHPDAARRHEAHLAKVTQVGFDQLVWSSDAPIAV